MNNKTNEFRLALAESGIEMTPDQARKAFKMARQLRKTAKRLSMQDLWDIEENDFPGVSKEERLQMLSLYRIAKEI